MADSTPIVTAPPTDALTREPFVSALMHHVTDLSSLELNQLPAPRVIAVDAPWGYGKSWVAYRLQDQLIKAHGPKSVVLIDAFRYDHHSDVFAVIASAVMKALDPKGKQKRALLQVAGKVMASAAPIAAKALINLATKTVGLDGDDISESISDAKDKVEDGIADFSEKAVEKMFKSYSDTEQVQRKFVESLSNITKSLPHPFVVIIDELDRCRPSFALEVLERVKHLFTADKVVFVLFWNSNAIHDSIRHTYGLQTSAESYLSKFVSLSVPLTLSSDRDKSPPKQYQGFIEVTAQRYLPSNFYDTRDFKDLLKDVAATFTASLRDVERVIRLFAMGGQSGAFEESAFVYLAMLQVMHQEEFNDFMSGKRQLVSNASMRQVKRIGTPSFKGRTTPLALLWGNFLYHAEIEKYTTMASEPIKDRLSDQDTHVFNSVGLNSPMSREHWLHQQGHVVYELIATPNFKGAEQPTTWTPV